MPVDAATLKAATVEWVGSNTGLTADRLPGIDRCVQTTLAWAAAHYDEPVDDPAASNYLHGLVLQCSHLVRQSSPGRDKKRPVDDSPVSAGAVAVLANDLRAGLT